MGQEPIAGMKRAIPFHNQEMQKVTAEDEEKVLLRALKVQYGKITGHIAPDNIMRHIASSDIQIFGEQHAGQQESHARDALDMSELAPDELKPAMLFHDIAKAGPDPDDENMTKLVATMYAYNYPYRERNTSPQETSVSEFLHAMASWIRNEQGLQPSQEKQEEFVERSLEMLQDLNTTNTELEEPSMRDFYDYHVQWGVQMNEEHSFIDNNDAFAAFGHHILPGRAHTAEDGTLFVEKSPAAKIPVIEGFTPTLEDIKRAAGTQALDYCNAVFTRRVKKHRKEAQNFNNQIAPNFEVDDLTDAMVETEQVLFCGIDTHGYETLVEEYEKKGVEITISKEDKEAIKQYIRDALTEFGKNVLRKFD